MPSQSQFGLALTTRAHTLSIPIVGGSARFSGPRYTWQKGSTCGSTDPTPDRHDQMLCVVHVRFGRGGASMAPRDSLPVRGGCPSLPSDPDSPRRPEPRREPALDAPKRPHRPPRVGDPMRKRQLIALALVSISGTSVAACAGDGQAGSDDSPEVQRWEERAERVTIIRDDWGIAHVYGQTDADAVFGMIYAQAEDDFNRIEVNFLNSQGRLAEAEGESQVWRDLRDEAVHRPQRHAGRVRVQPPVAEGPHGCLGRRSQLLPAHATQTCTHGSLPASSPGWR